MIPLPLLVTLHASHRLRAVVFALHLCAATAVWYAALPMQAQLVLSVVLIFSLWRSGPAADPVILRCCPDGGLEVRDGPEWGKVQVHPQSTVLPWLVVLRYRPQAGQRWRAWVILADSLPAEDFRRLRVWLKWLCAKSMQPAQVEGRDASPDL